MRRSGIVMVCLAVAGVAAFWWRAETRPVCTPTLEYLGVSYTVVHVSEEVGTADLGVGTTRGCGDHGRWRTQVAVSRVAGIDPRTALATPVAADVLFVAEGTSLDELPGDLREQITR